MLKRAKLTKCTSLSIKSISESAFKKCDKINKYKLTNPLNVCVYSEDSLFFVENNDLVIVGTGNSVKAATQDFWRHVIHFRGYYKALSINKITGDAVRLKKLYDTLFTKTEAKYCVRVSENVQ